MSPWTNYYNSSGPALPAGVVGGVASGPFLPDGSYLTVANINNAGDPAGPADVEVFITIDVATNTVINVFGSHAVSSFDDFALNPVDGRIYGLNSQVGRVQRINPNTGALTSVGPVLAAPLITGSSFFDSAGRMWMYGGQVSTEQDTLYRAEDPTQAPVAVGSGITARASDGTSCPFQVALAKTAAPATPEDACPDNNGDPAAVIAGGVAADAQGFVIVFELHDSAHG